MGTRDAISGAAPDLAAPPACSIIGIFDRKNNGFCKIRGLKSQWALAGASGRALTLRLESELVMPFPGLRRASRRVP